LTNRKNQNSFLILTTLGVYFGLLLVGGTPCVLAQHAATTKGFELKDEIEVKDDLDKKPETDTDQITSPIYTYLRDLDKYLKDVRTADNYLRSEFELDPQRFQFVEHKGAYQKDPTPVVAAPCYLIGKANRPFDNNIVGFTRLPILLNPYEMGVNSSWNLGCESPDDAIKSDRFTTIEVSRTYKDDLTFSFLIKLASTAEITDLFRNLETAFKKINAADLIERQKVLWENTKLTQTSDTVIIVTHLPRAGLDALLAEAK
jgi:hypothetical protein